MTAESRFSQPHEQGLDQWYIDEIRNAVSTIRHGPYPSRESAHVARRDLIAAEED